MFVHRRGNRFWTEIAELVSAAFQDLGLSIEVIQDGLPASEPNTVNVVIAPHEYFALVDGYPEGRCLAWARNCVVITGEQPGSLWFEEGFKYCKAARCVADINEAAAVALRARGLTTYHLPLGYHTSQDAWGGDASKPRGTDMLVLAGLTPRREAFLARHAGTFAAFNCRFILYDPSRPLMANAPNFITGRDKYRLLADTKILLNIHRSETQYFEWHRGMNALCNGCVFLTEPSQGYAPLRAFEHFVEGQLDLLPDYAVALLKDDDLRQRIARQAYEFMTTNLVLSKQLEKLIPFLEATKPHPKYWLSTRSPSGPARAGARTHSASVPSNEDVNGDGSLQRIVAGMRSEWERSRQSHRTVLETLLLNTGKMRRELEVLHRKIDSADFRMAKTPPFEAVAPDVTVAVAVHNHEHHVQECLGSILSCTAVVPEILVVNDHSQDRSEEEITKFLSAHQDFPIALVSLQTKRGLTEARNVGFRLARAEFVLVLDAEHGLYPQALFKLTTALERSRADFAYCMIERFGATTGLANILPWEPDRLTSENYIDATALIRRSSWQAVGGYDVVVDECLGLQDYDFWLSLADQGRGGILVPEILARHRVPGDSMTATAAALEMDLVKRYLKMKHENLPWPQ
jgi:GT2 family glycosyltransferase